MATANGANAMVIKKTFAVMVYRCIFGVVQLFVFDWEIC